MECNNNNRDFFFVCFCCGCANEVCNIQGYVIYPLVNKFCSKHFWACLFVPCVVISTCKTLQTWYCKKIFFFFFSMFCYPTSILNPWFIYSMTLGSRVRARRCLYVVTLGPRVWSRHHCFVCGDLKAKSMGNGIYIRAFLKSLKKTLLAYAKGENAKLSPMPEFGH